MKKPKLTRAEQLARHRQIFLLARERNLTLAEAEFALLREERAARLARRAAVESCGRAFPEVNRLQKLPDGQLRPMPDDAPWMMRD